MRLAAPEGKALVALQYAGQPGSRINIWTGSVRSGKTVNSLLAWMVHVATGPQGPLLMAGRTFDTLRRNVLGPLEELIGPDNMDIKQHSGQSTIMGRPVHLVGADNTSAESRIRGLTLAGSYCDELTILGGPNGRDWWNQLLARHSVEGAKVFATTNPDSPSHWLRREYLEAPGVEVSGRDPMRVLINRGDRAGIRHYHFTLDDNPTLPADYVASLKSSLSGVFYRRFIEGEWVAAEGAVFPMLDPEVHLVAGPPEVTDGAPIVGVDWGVSNPTHAVAVNVDRRGQRLTVLGELRLTDATATVADQAAALLAWIGDGLGFEPRAVRIVVDPSAKAFRNEVKTQVGRWPELANNAVLSGISATGALFGTDPPGLVLVDGACPELWRELVGYRWDTRAELSGGQARPVKEDDHGPDALRYAVQALRPVWERWRAHRQAPTRKVDELFLPW